MKKTWGEWIEYDYSKMDDDWPEKLADGVVMEFEMKNDKTFTAFMDGGHLLRKFDKVSINWVTKYPVKRYRLRNELIPKNEFGNIDISKVRI